MSEHLRPGSSLAARAASHASTTPPWIEEFDQSAGATSDDGETAWAVESAGSHPDVGVRSGSGPGSGSLTFGRTAGSARWVSDPIDISGGFVDLSITVRGSGSLTTPPERETPGPLDDGRAPTDPDLDGIYEDATGDGVVDAADVRTLLDNLGASAVADHVRIFDGNCNGRIDYDDAVRLAQTTRGAVGSADADCGGTGDRLEISMVVDGTATTVAAYDGAVSPDGETVETSGLTGETLQVVVAATTVDPGSAYHVDRVAVTEQASAAGATTELGQYGITWTFDGEYEYGRYATGDYWVVGPVTITGIDPPSTPGERTKHGSMLDPGVAESHVQAYDSAASYIGYDPSLNVALGVSAAEPLVVEPGSSLVSTVSHDEAGHRPQLSDAAVLTVVEAPPPEGAFRPPYFGTDTTTEYTTDDLSYAPLERIDPAGETPDVASVASRFARPWLDQISGWTTQMVVPSNNLPNYGREYATTVGKGTLVANLDVPDAEKRPLLIGLAQLGIDNFGIVQAGGTDHWTPNGGHNQGRLWPILFAGLLLGDDGMQSVGERTGAYLTDGTHHAGDPPDDYVHFGFPGQTFYVRETSPGTYNHGHGGYAADDVGLPEWGIRHSTRPSMDSADWDATYRRCCTANSMVGQVLSAHLMGATDLWNHEALFDYQDRYVAQVPDGHWYRSWDDFAEAMWDAYRDDYGGVWTSA